MRPGTAGLAGHPHVLVFVVLLLTLSAHFHVIQMQLLDLGMVPFSKSRVFFNRKKLPAGIKYKTTLSLSPSEGNPGIRPCTLSSRWGPPGLRDDTDDLLCAC